METLPNTIDNNDSIYRGVSPVQHYKQVISEDGHLIGFKLLSLSLLQKLLETIEPFRASTKFPAAENSSRNDKSVEQAMRNISSYCWSHNKILFPSVEPGLLLLRDITPNFNGHHESNYTSCSLHRPLRGNNNENCSSGTGRAEYFITKRGSNQDGVQSSSSHLFLFHPRVLQIEAGGRGSRPGIPRGNFTANKGIFPPEIRTEFLQLTTKSTATPTANLPYMINRKTSDPESRMPPNYDEMLVRMGQEFNSIPLHSLKLS